MIDFCSFVSIETFALKYRKTAGAPQDNMVDTDFFARYNLRSQNFLRCLLSSSRKYLILRIYSSALRQLR
ncbi:uncharacterized protein PHALS_02111 [Plasmopara halstedii]|uniref:Uncharacterized protein n=1 Tax=Plasmopara halstedii TaxID=4781 RepID=A0A0P1ATX3_PLAHL|nr:uncharacterized protein PHALS_02111 [Plasmopara halstedii]CEG45840.1 hypothetical protein PHALS_02111 [Plasmopara halstedii]|eukprot:XP_024582209.1 hypothetical protein PHALS_02111 [Plasmopara halstedii]